MNDTGDAFERLRRKTRASVPNRNTSLLKDQKTEFSHLEESFPAEATNDSKPEIQSTEAKAGTSEELEVTRRTIRLDAKLDDEIEQLCRREKITREVFLESAYLTALKDPAMMQEIVALAQSRYRQRKAIGEQRKFQTMAKRYQQDS